MSSVVLRLDYATMNFDAGSMCAESVGRSLVGDPDVLCWRQLGTYENAPLYSPLGLRFVRNNGFAARPHKLEVSGVGCKKFLPTLPLLRDPDTMHFSRLDFAFDVVMDRKDWRVFLGNCFISSMDSERAYKRYRLAGDGEAMTVYIGSRRAAKFFRIYNKTLEDQKYQYYDPDGNEVTLSEDQCVIRYEVELHRWKSVGAQKTRLFDPSPCFDWYYSADPADHERLHDEIKRMWSSFGNDVLLPVGWDDLQFVDLTSCNKNENFVQSSTDAEKLEAVQEALHDYPHSFDRTLRYLSEKFGKYIPYLLADADYRHYCWERCKEEFGFAPDYYFEPIPQGYNDMDYSDPDDDVPGSWCESAEEGQLLIDSSFERRYNQWS